MDLIKQSQSSLISVAIIYLALGIIMVVTPVLVSNFICYIIGILLIIVGGSGIYTYIKAGESGGFAKITLLISVLFTALGIYILISPNGFVSIIPLVVGVMLIIESFDKISNALNAKKLGYNEWYKMLIASIIIFILGLVLVFNPFESVTMFIRVIGIFLIIDAISNIYLSNQLSKI